MQMIHKEALTFDDVSLIPQYSEVNSRAKVDVSVKIRKNGLLDPDAPSFKFSSPLIPANMATISGEEMLFYTCQHQSLGLLHRFMSWEEKHTTLTHLRDKCPDWSDYVGVSVGVKTTDYEEVDRFVELGVKIICVDVAHLDGEVGLRMVKHLATYKNRLLVIAGTVATYEGTLRAFEAGADMVRVGISSGSICTTRIETGNGVPQLSAIEEARCAKRTYMDRSGRQVYLISDGGITKPADFCKALCFTDMVIAGNVFAGTDEAPGKTVEIDGAVYKHYDGSSTHKSDRVEGVHALVPRKTSAGKVFERMHQGLQSCCSYQNCHAVSELQTKAVMQRITQAGVREGDHHNVVLRETT